MDSILASHTGSGPWFLHFLVATFIQYYFDANMFRIKIQTRVNAFNSNESQIDLWTVRRCFRHFMKMYSNSGKLWSKGSSNFNIAKNSFIYAFTAIKITTAILNTYVENVSSISRCVWLWKDPAQFGCSDIYPTLSFHVQLHWCKKGPYYRYRVSIETFLTF